MSQSVYGGPGFATPVPDSRIRWRAVVAGVVAGMIVQVILTLLGMAIGLNALNPGAGDNNYDAVGIGSTIWLLISAIASGFFGGWVASALSNATYKLDGIMHGILSWGVFMVIAAFLLGTGTGTILGGAFNMTSATLAGASEGAAVQGVSAVREQVQTVRENVLPDQMTQGVDPERATDVAAGAMWGTFVIALLSLAASAFGGMAGLKAQPTRDRYDHRTYDRDPYDRGTVS